MSENYPSVEIRGNACTSVPSKRALRSVASNYFYSDDYF